MDHKMDKSLCQTFIHVVWSLAFHHTCEYKQYFHVGNTVKQCRLGLFQDSDIARDLDRT